VSTASTKYKCAEHLWLQEVPIHWDIKRLRYAAHLVGEKVEADDDEPKPYIGLEHIQSWTGKLLDLDPDFLPDGVSHRASAGDVLFGKLRPYLAKATIADRECLCSTEILVIRGHHTNQKYLLYSILSHGFIAFVNASTYGVKMPRANWDDIGNLPIPLPPLSEQQAIAAFLDQETARIDGLIAKKRRLIELLHEKRTALITRAVTKGLDPNAPMKDSGIEWLGEIPAHWEVKPVWAVVTTRGGSTPSKEKGNFWDGDIPWISPKDMKIEKIEDSQDHVSEDALRETNLSYIEAGAILIVVRGMILAHSFPVALTTSAVTINQDMKAITPGIKLNAEYLMRLMQGMKSVFVSFTDESAHGTKCLRTEIWSRLKIALPPVIEQARIVEYVNLSAGRFASLIDKAQDAIARLTEYRTALISAAVTGKIDVRAADDRVPAEEIHDAKPASAVSERSDGVC